ncbi:MAG TPA: AMP-binding protein, partial [Vicinamibacteria bacterium]
MLLYITAEDVFGSGTPERRGPRPLHTIPSTLPGLYDLGLRHHVRSAAMEWWTDGTLEAVPDWKLDRLAIRLALFGRERLGMEPGERVAVLGPLGWLWPSVDFAAMGFGVLAIGLEHDLPDDAVASVFAEAAPRAAFAADAEAAGRLLRLRRAGRLGGAMVIGEGLPEEEGLLPLAGLLDLAAVLDTAERAQAFRAFSRQVAPESPALWHVGARGAVRLTHQAAMAQVAPRLQARPASEGDVAYVDAPRVTLRKRLGMAAFVGDGHTTTALGRSGRATEDVAEVRPHKVLASEPWVAASGDGGGSRWPLGLDRRWARRRVRGGLGGRLRWVEVDRAVSGETARA